MTYTHMTPEEVVIAIFNLVTCGCEEVMIDLTEGIEIIQAQRQQAVEEYKQKQTPIGGLEPLHNWFSA